MRAGSVQDLRPYVVHGGVAQDGLRLSGHLVQDGPHGCPHILARGLGRLDVDVDTAVLAGRAAVQQLLQREQRRGLAGLARCVQDEVLPPRDEEQELVEVETVERRHVVVDLRDDGTFGVEEAHGGSIAPFRDAKAAARGGVTRDQRGTRLRLGSTRHARRLFLARAGRAPPTRRSLGPSRRKPLSETWLNRKDRRGARHPVCRPWAEGARACG